MKSAPAHAPIFAFQVRSQRRRASVIIAYVSLQITGYQTESYRVSTAVYEGPLDLLLELIERAELDITSLALAQVTDQYLAYLQNLKERDPASVSAFLVIAARLLQIKSAALLPRPILPGPSEDEEDPGEALARQLIQYRRFKQIAGWLAQREEAGLRTYLRVAPPLFKVETKLDLTGLTLQDLVRAAHDIFINQPSLTELGQVVTIPRITIREKIHSLLETLKTQRLIHFKDVLHSQSRVEIVVTFLALLELVKRHVVQAQQANLFGDIQMEAVGELEGQEESELDFQE